MKQFIIVAHYQYRENYNLDDPVNNPYWKNKGGHEQLIATVYAQGRRDIDEKMIDTLLKNDDIGEGQFSATQQFILMNTEVVEIGDVLLALVRDALIQGKTDDCMDSDFDYVRYKFSQGEIAFDIATDAMIAAGALTVTGNKWVHREYELT